MTDKEVMQMALDALEDFRGEYGWLPKQEKAWETLRARLAQPPKDLELPLVRPAEFVKLIQGKENYWGIPVMRTEWPMPELVIQAREEGDLIVADLPQVPTGGGGISKDEQPEPEPEKSQDKPCVEDDGCPTEKAVLQRFWREHQAQPEQEPVAWGIANTRPTEKQPLMMVMLDKPEPSHLVVALYTAPPQREWVGLTDEDKKQIAMEANNKSEMSAWEYAQRVGELTEAKLKGKNA